MKCSGTNANGEPCGGNALPGKALCFVHDPDSAPKAAEGRRRGGQNRKTPPATLPADTPDLPLASVEDVRSALAECYNAVRCGRMAVNVGNALAVIGQGILRALQQGDVEKRLQEVEEFIAKARAAA